LPKKPAAVGKDFTSNRISHWRDKSKIFLINLRKPGKLLAVSFFKNKKVFLKFRKNDKNSQFVHSPSSAFISLKIKFLKHKEMPCFLLARNWKSRKTQNETKRVSFHTFNVEAPISEVDVLQLTMTGEYTVRTMLHLATQPAGAIVQIAEISRQWDIPENFLRKIVQVLAKSRLILSRRGIGGGIELAKPAENITLLEVVEAAEGKLALNKCLVRPGMCRRDPWCAVHLVWCEAQKKMKEILSNKSIAELARQNLARGGQMNAQK
jgi:Rrf2 family protein